VNFCFVLFCFVLLLLLLFVPRGGLDGSQRDVISDKYTSIKL